MHPDNSCSINAVEAIPLSELDLEAARAGLAKFEVCGTPFVVNPQLTPLGSQTLAREGANEEEKATAVIGVSLHQAMVHALQ